MRRWTITRRLLKSISVTCSSPTPRRVIRGGMPAEKCAQVEDYFPQKKRWWLRLNEKNGKVSEMPCHHNLELYLDEYIQAAGIADDRKKPLFRSAIGKTKTVSARGVLRSDVWAMIRRRAAEAGIETPIGCHTFRATGITDYVTNGGKLEIAQKMAGHSNAKTTGLYDRRNDDISVSEVERVGI